MSRMVFGLLVALAATLYAGRPALADQHERSDFTWSRAYTLTPMEHKRLRAYGLSDEEVFVVANTANLTGRYVNDVVYMVLRGETARSIARRFNLDVGAITAVRPEWKTEAWKAAVERGDYLWVPPRS